MELLAQWPFPRISHTMTKRGFELSRRDVPYRYSQKASVTSIGWFRCRMSSCRAFLKSGTRAKLDRHHVLCIIGLCLLASLPEPCRTIVLVAVLAGTRIGEILALRWKRLDLLRGSILIRETISEGLFGSPKTKSSRRDVPMSVPVREALQVQRIRSRQTGPEDLVFATRKQTPLNPKNLLRRDLRPTCIALGLPLITWHSFRHTHATLLSETGESLRTAQAILGHSDIETTLNVYTHAIPESQRRAVDKIAGILFADVRNNPVMPENQQPN